LSHLPAAVLWDMDGTLINSEPLWMAAETELVHGWGGEWTHEDGLTLVGNPMPVSAAVLQERGVDLSIEEIIDFLNGRVAAAVAAQTPWQPGARELLTALDALGVPQALVTSSYRELADPFAGVVDLFAAVVAGDDVQAPKPDRASAWTSRGAWWWRTRPPGSPPAWPRARGCWRSRCSGRSPTCRG
jgi:beta-phosphoglucomutase-like phosphatase (HAD superfamily)